MPDIPQLLQDIERAKNSSAKDFLRVIEELRREVVLDISQSGGLTAANQGDILSSINGKLDAIRSRLQIELSANQQRIFKRSIGAVNKLAKGAGLVESIPFLTETKLKQLQDYSAELVTRLTDQARKMITSEINLSVLGQKPLVETIAAIGKNLDDPSVFGSIAKRAEVIQRTETNRINQIATVDRLKQLESQGGKISKRWVHGRVGIPRNGHLDLDGVTIPFNGLFELVGDNGTTYKITAPYDPQLPVEESVNCRCIIVPVIEKKEGTIAPAPAPIPKPIPVVPKPVPKPLPAPKPIPVPKPTVPIPKPFQPAPIPAPVIPPAPVSHATIAPTAKKDFTGKFFTPSVRPQKVSELEEGMQLTFTDGTQGTVQKGKDFFGRKFAPAVESIEFNIPKPYVPKKKKALPEAGVNAVEEWKRKERAHKIEVAHAAKDTVSEIDDLLSVPEGGQVKQITYKASSNSYGFYAGNYINVTPTSYGKIADHPRMTTAHEFGHQIGFDLLRPNKLKYRVDAKGRGIGIGSADVSNAAEDKSRLLMADLQAALESSSAIKSIRADRPYNADYYLKPHEQLARSFAQYVAKKTQNPKMLEELERMRKAIRDDNATIASATPQAAGIWNRQTRNKTAPQHQWEDSDFEGISNAYDDLFEKMGWLKPTATKKKKG